MALTVESPDPPEITNRGVPAAFDPAESYASEADFRREELQEFLDEGAWKEAFDEWAEYTDLSAEEYEQVQEFGLVGQLDVFWDPVEERLRAAVPDVPTDWAGGTDLASKVGNELSDLGDAVVEMLEDGYVEWGTDEQSEERWSERKYSEELEFSGEPESFEG